VEKLIKKIIFLTAILSVSLAHADDSGSLYMGLGFGAGLTNAKVTTPTSISTIQSTQFAGNLAAGLYVGYDFNHYVGIQADYNYIADTNIQVNFNSSTGVNTRLGNSEQVVDLGVTGHLPLELIDDYWLSGYYLYGRVSLGYDFASLNGGSSDSNGGLPGTAAHFVPIYAGGIEYGTGQVGFRLEYNYMGQISADTNTNNHINVNHQMVMISTLYHF
jgi:hypothetical protein